MDQQEITFSVPDMKCEGCAGRIQNVLERMEGGRSAEARLDGKQATIRYDADVTGPDAFRAAVEKAGYTPA